MARPIAHARDLFLALSLIAQHLDAIAQVLDPATVRVRKDVEKMP